MLDTPLAFLRGWSRNPVAVGLPIASSPWTAQRLAEAALAARISHGGPVLELGAGTGPVTQAFLDAGCRPDELVVVERDAELCATLEERCPAVRVLHGDALDLSGILDAACIGSVSVVLSGLPMRAIPAEIAARCYAAAFALMPRGGAIIQYTYGLRPPVDPQEPFLQLDATFVGREWRNVPPMGIWSYRLVAAPHGAP